MASDNARRRQRADTRDQCYLLRLAGWVKSRCENKSWSAASYRDRGIECRVDVYDIALIWIRDKAWLIESPHLDRIDPDGHYEIGNIRFITAEENLARRRSSVDETNEFLDSTEQPILNDNEGREPGMEG